MPYRVGSKGSYGCSGYPAVKDDGTVMGCHKSKSAAARQIYAINISEGKIGKAMVKEGDMVMAPYEEGEVHVGRVVHVMTDGMLGMPGSEYAIAASPEEPAVLIQLFEMEEGGLEETEYFVGHKASEVMAMPSLESNVGMDKSMHESEEDEEDDEMDKEYKGCGCPTCKELNVDCPDCPVCQGDMNKAKKPNYEDMIKPRRGGSDPSNARLYAQIIREAKDKFDVYPSAVANAWVVQEYKRRGGSYKTEKREFSTANRERMAEAGTAMPDGSFPIANRADLMNAIRSVGRAKNYDAAKKHIINRARALNAIDMLPEDWKPGVRKTMWGGSVFDLNPFVK
jgi:hypothetical protein